MLNFKNKDIAARFVVLSDVSVGSGQFLQQEWKAATFSDQKQIKQSPYHRDNQPPRSNHRVVAKELVRIPHPIGKQLRGRWHGSRCQIRCCAEDVGLPLVDL